jgi:tetratricopeptide (TPR) repeat protein
MRCIIEQIVLWPRDTTKQVFSLNFSAARVNIIHGRSGTGKSSIIAIVDFCLGATRCAIPVGVIRDATDWFGLVLNLDGRKVLVARRTPGMSKSAQEFFIDPQLGALPATLIGDYSMLQFKDAFNGMLGLTNLPMTTEEKTGPHDGRPSYRDLAAFNFLPQHIVANPNTLFFKADTYEHRERLRRVMPYALGIIDTEYVANERERARLQRVLDDMSKQLLLLEQSLQPLKADIDALWIEAKEIGLIVGEGLTLNERIERFVELIDLLEQQRIGERLQTPDYALTNQRYKDAVEREARLQKAVDEARRQVRGLEQLSKQADDFRSAVKKERSRVINLDWLQHSVRKGDACIACGSASDQLTAVISHLEAEVNHASELQTALFNNPVVDREIEKAKDQLKQLAEQLQRARMQLLPLVQMEKAAKNSLSRVYLLLGRIQSTIKALEKVGKDSGQEKRIGQLQARIARLDAYFTASGRELREQTIDAKISELIAVYANGFKLEQRGDIRLDKKELTLSFNRGKAKPEFLWEVGSGANWMGYHISAFLALHEFLSHPSRNALPVFSFLLVDQPSQVYFPSASSGANELDADPDTVSKLLAERDVDVLATKRIFSMLELALERAQHQFQIIVLEHADRTIWGEHKHMNEVAKWKNEGEGLIPAEWLR